MFATLFLLLAASFAESKTLALQVHLDRAGYSCNTIDGQWGRKSERALAKFVADRSKDSKSAPVATPADALDAYFAGRPAPLKTVAVEQSDIDAVVAIPEDPGERAKLRRMGYESVKEMFAERGHLSQIALAKLNPGVDWKNVRAGQKIVIPDFPPIEEELAAGNRGDARRPKRPEAELVKISISESEITAFDASGRTLALFPCSIAANKKKIPAHGELKITSYVAWPNFTYTPDNTPQGQRVYRHVWPEGENCPVGVAWMGLNLPGYGIHGTPRPESVGFTGSHGCFRLANWNAARLYAMCRSGTKVVVEE
ncbi:MAG: L,D-transpeptidase [Kiritimatiellae bacterium]|nr:L,D-transpeptidase [Kiritimatiellia bacterium]